MQLAIQALERQPTVPRWVYDIVGAMGPLVEFSDAGDRLIIAGDYADRLNTIDRLIQVYILRCTPAGELYSIDTAADYLGVTRDQVLAWTSRSKGFHRLKGSMMGKALYFTQTELDIHQKVRVRRKPVAVQPES